MVVFQSDGRRKYKSFYAKTQKEVKEKAKVYQSTKAEGLNVDTVYYFADWADMWFKNHKANIMSTTQESYQYTLRILKANFPPQEAKGHQAYRCGGHAQKPSLRRALHFLPDPVQGYDVPDHEQGRGQNLTGKAIVPFATSGGSDMGKTNEKLMPSCPGAKLIEGKFFNHSASHEELAAWVDGLQI